ncbi:unnamed protein product [Caretta caretta]
MTPIAWRSLMMMLGASWRLCGREGEGWIHIAPGAARLNPTQRREHCGKHSLAHRTEGADHAWLVKI